LVRRNECVPKKRGSSPTLAIHWETSRAYWRVVIGIPTATAGAEELARLLVRDPEVVVDGFSGPLRHLESDGLAGLTLAHIRPIDSVTVGRDVLDPQIDHVASAEFAIDGEVEHRQVADPACHLQFGADRPDMLRPERRLGADQFPFVPRFAADGRGNDIK
jgi:hypothetical protein